MITSTSNSKFKTVNGDRTNFRIETSLQNAGHGPFSFYKENGEGVVIIDSEAGIKNFSFKIGNKQFKTTFEKQTEKLHENVQ